jgi:hypothetical protein
LIPAAIPISAPPSARFRPRSIQARSSSTKVVKNTLTWPYFRFVRSGSSQMAAAEKASASWAARSRDSMHHRLAGHGGSRRTRYELTGSASTVAALTRTRPAVTGSQVSGANSRAANGG